MKITAKTVMKKMTALTLTVTMEVGLISMPGIGSTVKAEAAEQTLSAADGGYDYGRAWQQTLMFYEFQKSGLISKDDPSCNRNNWKGDCEWNDGQEIDGEVCEPLDLTGGWHDCGDHVKFNLPMAYAVTMMTWSYLEFKDTYDKTGQDKYALNEIRWVNDYLMRCHAKENLYFYQVGDGSIDHQFWGAPELIDVPGVREIQMPKISRPCYWVDNTAENGGSAVCAEATAALASASIVFKDSDPEYSEKCLKHAKELYQMALEAQSDKGYMKHAEGFYSSTHFEDELTWGGVWLYKATGEKKYLETAESYDHKWGGEAMVGNLKGNVWAQCWDDVRYGSMLLIAELDDGEKGQEHREGIEYNLDYWSTGVVEGNGNPARGKYTKRGLVMINDWGSVRYAGAEAAMAMFYCKWKDADPKRVEAYKEFAKAQADYILGSTGRNFIVGYNDASPRNPHHRTADGPWKNSPLKCPTVSRHTLVGAIVGGPDGSELYDDDRNNYCTNEVGNDYNVGPMCLMAAMYEEYGGTIDPDINAYEEVGEEYYMDGCNYQQGTDNDGATFCEVKLTIENHTAWPARASENLKFRYFVNIKDALEAGAKPEDFSIISYYAQRKSTVTNLIPWNPEEGIYYVEVAFGQEEEQLKAYDEEGIKYEKLGTATPFMYPGGDVECRADMQLRIASPAGVKWDYTKNPSYVEIKDTKVDEKRKIQKIAIYEGDKLVGGIEPSKTGSVDLSVPNVPVDDISIGEADSDGTVTPKINYDLKIGETCKPEMSTDNSVEDSEEKTAKSENQTYKIIINPSNATDKTLTWQSMNTNVATVDADGTITGVGKGSTSIIVWANGGGKPANLVVNVDGGVEDLYSAKVLNKPVDWTPPEVVVGEKMTNGDATPSKPSTTHKPSTRPSGNGSVSKPSGKPSGSESTSKPNGSEVTSKPSESEPTSKPNGSEVTSKPSENKGSTSPSQAEPSKNTPSGVEPSKDSPSQAKPSKDSPSQVKPSEDGQPSKTEPSETEPSKGKPSQIEPSKTEPSKGSEVPSRTSDAGSNPSMGSEPDIPSSEPEKISVINVKFAERTCILTAGETKELKYDIFPENATNQAVTFESNAPLVAGVDKKGNVTAISEGKADITVKTEDGQKKDVCTVIVKSAGTEINVSGIDLNETEYTLHKNETLQLKATVLPENATNKKVTFVSSNPDDVSVDENGLVTVRNLNTSCTIITATTEDGSFSKSCKIYVKARPGDSDIEIFQLDKKELSMTVGNTDTLNLTFIAEGEIDKAVIWESDDEDIAVVNNDGEVEAISAGTAQIKVSSVANPAIYAICDVTVKEKPAVVNSIKVKKSITMTVSGKYTLTASALPSTVTNKNVTFKSNSSIVKIISKTGTKAKLQAKAPGITTITIKSKANNKITKKVTIKVLPAKVSSLKKKKVSSSKIVLTFKKQKGISGYEVQRYDTKSKKYKVYKRTKSTKINVTKLKKKTSYKFRVRAYKTVKGTKLYGKYSNVLTVKTK